MKDLQDCISVLEAAKRYAEAVKLLNAAERERDELDLKMSQVYGVVDNLRGKLIAARLSLTEAAAAE